MSDAAATHAGQIEHLNQALEDRIRELTDLNRELEAFTYSVSHDLRSPLRHIEGYAEMILEDFGARLPAEVLELLGRIRQETGQMSTMVNELLNLSRLGRQELELRTTSLGALVEEVLAALEPDAEGRDLRFEIGELGQAHCDPELIKLALTNLVSNAIKFTRSRRPGVIEIGRTLRDGRAALFVRDNGVGFNMKYADKLFGVFQRLHRREDFEGTGVGLATVQRIIHKHAGEVWAEAEPNKGATFYFTLNAATARKTTAACRAG